MAISANRLEAVSRTVSTDALLVEYMRASLRTGSLAQTLTSQQDVRTCANCGLFARFEPDADAATWSTCSACGEIA